MVTADDFGANSGLIEELFDRYLENPERVPERWRRYFAEHPLDGNGEQAVPVAGPPAVPPPAAAVEPVAPDTPVAPEVPAAPATLEMPEMPVALTPPPLPAPEAQEPQPHEPPDHEERDRGHEEHEEPLRGVWARIAQNMEASLEVPTATSVRTVPAKLLEVNRQILNNHLARTGGGKVSFTHLIAFAVLRALG